MRMRVGHASGQVGKPDLRLRRWQISQDYSVKKFVSCAKPNWASAIGGPFFGRQSSFRSSQAACRVGLPGDFETGDGRPTAWTVDPKYSPTEEVMAPNRKGLRTGSRSTLVVTLLICSTLLAGSQAADPDAKNKQSAKVTGKPAKGTKQPASPALIALEKVFKAWDLDKDGSINREELQKLYKSRTTAKKPGAAKNQNPDLPEPVLALLQKMDTSQDDQISELEFAAWAPGFAEHLMKIGDVRRQIPAAEQRLAETRRVMSRGRNVTALEGIGNDLGRRAVLQCELDLEQLQTALQKLENDGGHSNYRAFMEWQLNQRLR